MPINAMLDAVTRRIVERSRAQREEYLARMGSARGQGPQRKHIGCGNLAHAFAGSDQDDKAALRTGHGANIAIVTAYNDMLSAHQPFERYPELIRRTARSVGATAQVAGGVPAMCDGVTQGRAGMELSLFSRDVIALAAAVSLSHDVFDAALYLGVCDKIVPGLLIAALTFGHLPAIFVPAGPMASGIGNDEKSHVRQLHAEGKATREELLEVEARSYHSPGTCTFYGTANSNQMLMEIMGLHLPGASFVNPNTPLRDALTVEATIRVGEMSGLGDNYTPVAQVVDERAIVNGVVGLLATGGSTNHLLHLIAIAQAGGIALRLEDFGELAQVVPLLARIYPNGSADVNHFDAAGGMGFLIGQLLDAGLLHGDVNTAAGPGLDKYRVRAIVGDDGKINRVAASMRSGNAAILRPASEPFSATGGLTILRGNLGVAAMKTSAVPDDRLIVEAPALVFDDQDDVRHAFERGELDRDFVAVVRFQGPRANGMPELHKLTPTLTVLQNRGFRVALLTDGRMSGASGKIPAAIHLSPEAMNGGLIGKIHNGDIVRIDATKGTLELDVSDADLNSREAAAPSRALHRHGVGRELFGLFRNAVGAADTGASVLGVEA